MQQEKPSLAKALPSEMGASFFAQVERTERLKLNKHARKHGTTENRLREGEAQLVAAIWERSFGIPLPAALTVKVAGHTRTLVVTRLQLEYSSWSFDWHIVLLGHNIRQTGAAGCTQDYISLPLQLPISMSKRDLTGQWQPVVVPPKAGKSC